MADEDTDGTAGDAWENPSVAVWIAAFVGCIVGGFLGRLAAAQVGMVVGAVVGALLAAGVTALVRGLFLLGRAGVRRLRGRSDRGAAPPVARERRP